MKCAVYEIDTELDIRYVQCTHHITCIAQSQPASCSLGDQALGTQPLVLREAHFQAWVCNFELYQAVCLPLGRVYVCMHAWPLCTGGVTCAIKGIDIVIASIASAAGIAKKPKFVAQSSNRQDPICDHGGDLCGGIRGGTGGCAGEAVHIGGVRDVGCCVGKCCDQAVGAVQNRQKSLDLQVIILLIPHALTRMQVTKIHEHMISVKNKNGR